MNDTSRTTRIDLGLVSLWPLVWCIIFYMGFGEIIDLWAFPGASLSPEIMVFGTILALIHLATVLIVIALMVLYVMEIATDGRSPRSRKVLWIVLVILGSVLTMPVYWYLYVWREPQTPPGEAQSGEKE